MNQKEKSLVALYNDPEAPGSLGGLARFAKAQGVTVEEAKEALSKDMSYTLHRPRQKCFPKARAMVYGMDHQWVADVVDVQKLSRQ